MSDGALHALALAATLAAAVLLLRRPDGARMAAPTLLLVVAADLVSANVRAYRLATPPERLPPSALRTCLAASGAVPGLITPFHLEPDPEDGLSPFESRWRRGAQTLLPAWNAADRVRNASPYSALYPLRYALYEERVPLETRVAALGLFGFAFVAVPGDPSLLDRTVLRPPWRVVAADPKFGVLVSIPHRARAYLADSARSATAGEALAFAADPASVSSSVTVVEGDVPQGLTGGSAEIALDLPDEVRVRTRSIGPALLVLDDAFAAGWTAAVDGTTAAIHAANYLARAVRLDPGAHEVVFTYRVPMLSVGWAIALGAFALAIAGHAVEHRLGRAGSPREAGSSPTKAGSAPRDG